MQPVFAPKTTHCRFTPRILALFTCAFVPLSAVLAFTWAPIATIGLGEHGVQYDFPQKIFYWHVPTALGAYVAFAAGAWNGLLYLLTKNTIYDLRSYVGIHVGLVFGSAVLITGSIWAKAAWGVWWNWGDTQLLVFLTLYLFYAAYFVLRFSLDAGRARATASSVYAVLGVALVPLSFLAIRIADTLIHPIVLTAKGDRLTMPMWGTFAVAVAGFTAMALWMIQLEVTGKLLDQKKREATDV